MWSPRASMVSLCLAVMMALACSGGPAKAADDMSAVVRMGAPDLSDEMSGLTGVAPEEGEALPGRRVKRYTETMISAWTEYRTDTCAEVSPGSWTMNRMPRYGKITKGVIVRKLTNGQCPGKFFHFAALYYEWSEHSNKSLTDWFQATWKSPHYTIANSFTVNVAAVRPARETTEFAGWISGHPTQGGWSQHLIPPSDDPSFDFSGESVMETTAAPGVDGCYFEGSIYAPVTTLSGGTWTVRAGNMWQYDAVGWVFGAVTYYRSTLHGPAPNHVSAPCSYTVYQQMKIKSPTETAYRPYGPVNTLRGWVGTTTVTSVRSGKSATRTWP